MQSFFDSNSACLEYKKGVFFCFMFFVVFQPGFVAFVASVAFVGVWLLWLYHALPIYLPIPI